MIITFHNEPKSLKKPVNNSKWGETMSKFLFSLEANQTWDLTTLPYWKKPINSKWVYKIKYHVDRSIKRHKVCLVANSFTQREGFDFHHTYASVPNWSLSGTFLLSKFLRGGNSIYLMPIIHFSWWFISSCIYVSTTWL